MRYVRFGELYKIPSCNGLSRPSAVRGEGYKMVNMGELFSNDIINDMYMERVQMNDRELKKFLLEKGDLLFARQSLVASGAGKCSIVNNLIEETTFESHLIRVRLDKSIANPLYYYYLFQLPYNPVKTIVNQCAQAGIRGTELVRIKVPLPDIEYQNTIANTLFQYDNLIENNNKRIKLLEQMAENLYKEWFVRFRFPGYEDVEFIDGFPKDWEKVKLDDVLNKIATGLNPRKNFVLGEGENFYVTIKNIADNTVYLDDKCDKVNDDAIIKINKRSDLKIGDLLFSGIGTIGRVCLIDIPTNNWNISESVFTMRANKKISSEFLYMLLLSQDVQNYCQSKANGSAQKGIRMGDLRKYTFLLPTKNVINDFTNPISTILRSVSLLRNENKNLIQQRDMLLPRLMSGKLEV